MAGEAPPSLRAGGITVRPSTLDVLRGGTLSLSGAPARRRATVLGQDVPVLQSAGRATARFGPFARGGRTSVTVGPPGAGPRASIRGLRVKLADREMACPLLMVILLPAGLLGLVVASLLAAFLSTIDTHTNWGASYMVQDIYRRFLRPDASERQCVLVSRLCIVMMASLAGVTALFVKSIVSVWTFMNTLGAGVGSVSAARWVVPRREENVHGRVNMY